MFPIEIFTRKFNPILTKIRVLKYQYQPANNKNL